MHTRYTVVLSAILGGYLTNAAHHRGALITSAPSAPDLVPRQDQQCSADYTTCADGYGGCCPAGEACTASLGVPGCGGSCGIADTICPDGGCCNLGEKCVLSTGNYYCTDGLIIPTYTAPVFSVPTVAVPTVTVPEVSVDTSSTPTSTSTTYALSTTSDESSNILFLPSASSSTSSEVFIPSEATGSGSSTSAAVTTSTFKAAGDVVSVAGPWTAGVLAWLTGLLIIA